MWCKYIITRKFKRIDVEAEVVKSFSYMTDRQLYLLHFLYLLLWLLGEDHKFA